MKERKKKIASPSMSVEKGMLKKERTQNKESQECLSNAGAVTTS